MKPNNTFSSTASTANSETVQALTNIYLASAERLAELNLNTVRDVLKETVTATRDRHGNGADSISGFSQAAFLQPMVNKAMAYSRNAFAILLEAQQEATKTVMSQISDLSQNFKLPTDWNASAEMLNKGVQQFSTLATQGASATSEVARKASESFTKATKAA